MSQARPSSRTAASAGATSAAPTASGASNSKMGTFLILL
jgi:hypothetical protein